MIPSYELLARRIRDELEALERTVLRAERAWKVVERAEADQDIYLDSVALSLQGYYSALERLFESIANRLNGGCPTGDSWHRELIEQMRTEIPDVRPAVIGAETAASLDELRRFRHVVRNVYAENLDSKRLSELMKALRGLWARLRNELERFADFLEGVSRADGESEAGSRT